LKYFQQAPNARLLAEHQLEEPFAVYVFPDQHIWKCDTVREIYRMLPTKEDIFSELEFVFKFYRGWCGQGNRRIYVEETNSKMYGVDQDIIRGG